MHCAQPPVRPLTPPRRAHAAWRSFVVAVVVALALPLHAVQPIKTYAALTLKDGRQFTSVEVISYTGNGVLVRHGGGATTFRSAVLPDHVLADLHLPAWTEADLAAAVADPDLGNRIALSDSIDPSIADRPAIPESAALDLAHRPALAVSAATDAVTTSLAAIADQPAIPATAASDISGEGNLPAEFFANLKPVEAAAQSRPSEVSGRVVVALPSGEQRLIADVEVHAYPASLLATYLTQAKARCNDVARKLRDEAAVAARENRPAEATAFAARADRIAGRYMDYLPPAPYTARSDAFGYFTLRHDLRDVLLVAAGRVTAAAGEWTYEWIGVAPAQETVLTEANATIVVAPVAPGSKYAAR